MPKDDYHVKDFDSKKNMAVAVAITGILILISFVAVNYKERSLKKRMRTYSEGQEVGVMNIEADSETLPRKIKVLSIAYYPPCGESSDTEIDDSSCVDSNVASTRGELKNLIQRQESNLESDLELGSAYHRYENASYQNPESEPYLDYEVIDSVEIDDHIPPSENVSPNGGRFPDYIKILTENVDICQYVDRNNVKEVWLWGYHNNEIEPVESNQSMGRISKFFFNHDTYGDISNSAMLNDMPQCEKTYTLYNYSVDSNTVNVHATHNHLHQFEALFFNLGGYKGMATFENRRNFSYRLFTGTLFDNIVCGNNHYDPLSEKSDDDYDHGKYPDKVVESLCPVWNLDLSNNSVPIRCSDWNCSHRGWHVWWMQSLPGYDNTAGTDNFTVRNFWDSVADLDSFLSKYDKLVKPNSPICGNGAVDEGEVCDDGNTSNRDWCTNTCKLNLTKTVLEPTEDTYIDMWAPANAYGVSPILNLRAKGNEGIQKILLKFDLSAFEGNSIYNASLKLHLLKTSNLQPIKLHINPIVENWGPGVTWKTSPAYSVEDPYEIEINPNQEEISIDITNIVENMTVESELRGTYGILVSATSSGNVRYAFASSEYNKVDKKPKLSIKSGHEINKNSFDLISKNTELLSDTYLNLWNEGEENGRKAGLVIRASGTNPIQIPLVKPNLEGSNLVQAVRAVLTFHIISSTNSQPIKVSALPYLKKWEEENITWKKSGLTAENFDSLPGDSSVIISGKGEYKIDITDAMQEIIPRWKDTGGILLVGTAKGNVAYTIAGRNYWDKKLRPHIYLKVIGKK